MNQSKVSVIIPCYNQGKYLNECIESILKSDYENYEIILINDGSTDPLTNQIIDELSHPKIYVYKTKNQGLAEARNTGIKKSKGEYILPLDADDKIDPSYINESASVLERDNNIKLVTCKVELFGAKMGIMELPQYNIETLLCRNIMVCSSVFRRSDYDKTTGYNKNMKYGFEDWDFWLSLLGNGGKVYCIPEVRFFYRIKKGSMIVDLKNSNEKIIYSRRQIYENHKELYSKHFFDPLKSFEYSLIKDSKEYRIGTFILKPVRFLVSVLRKMN